MPELESRPKQQLTCLILSETAESLAEWLEAQGALSVSFMPLPAENGSLILEPALHTTPLWPELQLVAHFDERSDLSSVLQSLNADPHILSCCYEPLPDRDWVKETQWFEPLVFEHFSILNELPVSTLVPDHPILYFNPGCGFGTGRHPTTHLCLETLDRLGPEGVSGKKVLDFGSGSGILGLSALMLGASRLYAVDHDQQALDATHQNAERNQLVSKMDAIPDLSQVPEGWANLIFANVLAEPLIQFHDALLACLAPQGCIVLSGILNAQLDGVLAVYGSDFERMETVSKEGWVRIVGLDRRIG